MITKKPNSHQTQHILTLSSATSSVSGCFHRESLQAAQKVDRPIMSHLSPIGQFLFRTAQRSRATSHSSYPSSLSCEKLFIWAWQPSRAYPGGEHGDGAGRGGGAGGAIREAGGAFGKMEAYHEEKYFREEQIRQLKEMKSVMTDVIRGKLSYHEKQLSYHMEGIKRHREQLAKDDNKDLHLLHIQQHQDAIRQEEEQIKRLQTTWKKLL